MLSQSNVPSPIFTFYPIFTIIDPISTIFILFPSRHGHRALRGSQHEEPPSHEGVKRPGLRVGGVRIQRQHHRHGPRRRHQL